MRRAWCVISLVLVVACEAAAQNNQVSPGLPPVKLDAAASGGFIRGYATEADFLYRERFAESGQSVR